ncbi:hypothetical protein BG015_002732 [Linnemannia schmuckeri]|uniref:F-box domain-containing protein n=1 Tax=Linnemannia schmuckeri TaxID=64567 RepID=A0A9P5RRR8_9FUNG|nr:hypothetical protein BG015_002732 [Linnemannia schmuckeri]
MACPLPWEIIRNVGDYLDPPQLLVCIQLASSWKPPLIPRLWSAIYDHSYSWHKVLKQDSTTGIWTEADDQRLRDLFVKYGHHIRELDVSSPHLIAAASSAGTCTNLRSLRIRFLDLRRPYNDPSGEEQGGMIPESLISPIFEEHLQSILPANRGQGQGDLNGQVRLLDGWNLVQHIWLLVRKNARLRQLVLCKDISELAMVSSSFSRASLAILRDLEELDYSPDHLDLSDILIALPKLRSLGTSLTSGGSNYLLPTSHQLERLDLHKSTVGSGTMHNLLENLPGLVSLTIGAFHLDGWMGTELVRLSKSRPSQLKELYHISPLLSVEDYWAAMLLIPRLPCLTTLVVDRNSMKIAKAAGKHCRQLRVFRQTYDGFSIHPVDGVQLQPDSVCEMLETCLDLEELDAIHHKMEVQSILVRPWVCAQMTVFRCQIVGVNRLTVEEQKVVDPLAASGRLYSRDSLEGEERLAVERLAESWEHQQAILGRIGQWTSLKTLCFGHEYRNYRLHQLDEPPYYTVDEIKYLQYDGPIPNTLELSLESGLGRLAGLKDLEVFGFEGLDHRIGKAELNWMAVNWPKLKIMRGLHVDTMTYVEYNVRRAELREYFQKLRPDVVHATKKTSLGLGL